MAVQLGDEAPDVVDLQRSQGRGAGQFEQPAQIAPVGGDGMRRLPALLGQTRHGREWIVTQAGALSVVAGTWKYIEPRRGPRLDVNTNTELGNDPEPQLYDTDADPGETRNLARVQPAKLKELAGLLARVRAGK